MWIRFQKVLRFIPFFNFGCVFLFCINGLRYHIKAAASFKMSAICVAFSVGLGLLSNGLLSFFETIPVIKTLILYVSFYLEGVFIAEMCIRAQEKLLSEFEEK